MSAAATAWAWQQISVGDLTAATALVLLKLADRADPRSGACWPSAALTAEDCGLGKRTVERCLAELRVAGLIEIQPRYDQRGVQMANLFKLAIGGQLADGQQPPGAATALGESTPGQVAAAREHLRRQRAEIAGARRAV
jgi:hypothetical protein